MIGGATDTPGNQQAAAELQTATGRRDLEESRDIPANHHCDCLVHRDVLLPDGRPEPCIQELQG